MRTFLLSISLAFAMFAQAPTASLVGRVTDPTGKIWDEVWGHTGKG